MVSSFRLGLVTVFAFLRSRVRRILRDFYSQYLSPEVTVKLQRRTRGHFVTLVKRNAGYISCLELSHEML